MPPFKRQHYLPAAYLKPFSADPTILGRKTPVWRIDRFRQLLVTAESQCAEDYYFSKSNAQATEEMLQGVESRYTAAVNDLILGRSLLPEMYGAVLIAMFDFHLRNAIHANLTNLEGIEAYGLRLGVFLNQLLLGRVDGPLSADVVAAHIERHWEIRILPPCSSPSFITSDNPSVLVAINEQSPTFDGIIMPLTPFHIAIGYDKRKHVCLHRGKVTQEEVIALNMLQLFGANECIYAQAQFLPEQVGWIQQNFATRNAPPCEMTFERWTPWLISPEPSLLFPFVRRIPLLM